MWLRLCIVLILLSNNRLQLQVAQSRGRDTSFLCHNMRNRLVSKPLAAGQDSIEVAVFFFEVDL